MALLDVTVGDIIKGVPFHNAYSVTNSNALMRVVDISGSHMKVVVVHHSTTPEKIDHIYPGIRRSTDLFVKYSGEIPAKPKKREVDISSFYERSPYELVNLTNHYDRYIKFQRDVYTDTKIRQLTSALRSVDNNVVRLKEYVLGLYESPSFHSRAIDQFCGGCLLYNFSNTDDPHQEGLYHYMWNLLFWRLRVMNTNTAIAYIPEYYKDEHGLWYSLFRWLHENKWADRKKVVNVNTSRTINQYTIYITPNKFNKLTTKEPQFVEETKTEEPIAEKYLDF